MYELWDVYDENRKPTGKTVLRSEHKKESDEYHIVVHIWIRNSRGEWLIQKRSANKSEPLKWAMTGGSALAGEDSITAALREAKEELGLDLDADKATLYKSIKRQVYADFCDIWIFEHNCDIGNIVLQKEEACDAMWASGDKILSLIDEGKFASLKNSMYVYDIIKL